MRPQRNAAENAAGGTSACSRDSASMRPQRNAAENEHHRRARAHDRAASMRPQRNAAENVPHIEPWAAAEDGFNEAAA